VGVANDDRPQALALDDRSLDYGPCRHDGCLR
jgi:hypothetical protein